MTYNVFGGTLNLAQLNSMERASTEVGRQMLLDPTQVWTMHSHQLIVISNISPHQILCFLSTPLTPACRHLHIFFRHKSRRSQNAVWRNGTLAQCFVGVCGGVKRYCSAQIWQLSSVRNISETTLKTVSHSLKTLLFSQY